MATSKLNSDDLARISTTIAPPKANSLFGPNPVVPGGYSMKELEELANKLNYSMWKTTKAKTMSDYFNSENSNITLMGAIAMRLRVTKGNIIPFEFINAHKITPERYVVFVVHNGQPMIIEDDNLFPSDALVSKLFTMIG